MIHRKVFPEEPTENSRLVHPSKIAFEQETLGGQKAERFRGVEYKYNRQGTALSV